MREIISYLKSKRLARVHRTRIGQTAVIMALYVYLALTYFNKDGIDYDFLIISGFAMIIISANTRNINSQINLASIYPISYKRRVIYDFLYGIFAAIVGMLTIIAFFLLIFGIVYLVAPENFRPISEETVEHLNKTIYYGAWFTSVITFVFLLGFIKKDRNWWISMFSGMFGYFVINAIVVSVLSKKFKVLGYIPQLIKENPNLKVFVYLISSFLFLVAIGQFFGAFYLKKPKLTIKNTN